jgi:hypothetical protein
MINEWFIKLIILINVKINVINNINLKSFKNVSN